MRISPISYISNTIYSQKPVSHTNMSQPADVFIKEPAFRGYQQLNISPFLKGEMAYTPKNIEKFKQIIENLDLKNRADNLLQSIINEAKERLAEYNDKSAAFSLDFLINNAQPDIFKDIVPRKISRELPKIKFSEENKPNINAILAQLGRGWSTVRANFYIYKEAIENENTNLLKTLIQDNNWKHFFFHPINTYDFDQCELQIIRQGQNSKNPEIKELFNGKNLYNLLNQYQHIYTTVRDDARIMFDLGMVYLYETPDSKELRQKVEDIAYHILDNETFQAESYLSEIPLSKYELYKLQDGYSHSSKTIRKAINMRIEKLIKRNGIDTPEQILACLNDKIMTQELLSSYHQDFDFTILDKIADMPVNDKSKLVIPKIIDKLAEMGNFPDNKVYRYAGVKAAKQGNVELLKFFDSKHIHFANLINEPLNAFPEEVRDILKNAKINNTDILEYARFPKFIDKYLQQNSNVDINSRNPRGDSLLSLAIKSKSLETLQLLAKRNDVDWNITDNNGENILMQILEKNKDDDLEFKKKAIALLRDLPQGKFDINYINTQNSNPYEKIYTALSKIFSHCDSEYDLLDDVLEFKDINTNLDPTSGRSYLLQHVNNPEIFKKLFLHPNTDITLIKEEDLEKLRKDDVRISNEVLRFLKEQNEKSFANNMLKRYETNGMLSPNEIKEFVSYENFDSIADTKFNIFGENIAHLLVDIFPDVSNPKELRLISEIVDTLKQNEFDFNMKDELDRTPLDKAIEGDNEIMVDLLKSQ